MSAAASARAKKYLIDSEDSQCYNGNRRITEPGQPGTRMRKQMKRFSFADAYGLGLIAKNPKDDWSGMREHLSVEAQKIAQELISPSNRTSQKTKSAADELRNLVRKVDKTSAA